MTLEEILALPIHPAAAVFPMLPDDELDELAEDIKANGLQQPIVVKEMALEGDPEPYIYLVDGRNRREACKRAGVEPDVRELNGADPVAFIISSNINRRHMTKQQRLIAVATIRPDPEPGKRNDLTCGNLPQVDRSNLARARIVVKWAPDLASRVLKAGMAFDKAHEEAKKRKDESESHDTRLAALRTTDPDLADRVSDEQQTLEDAEDTARGRRLRTKQEREQLENVLLETFKRGLNSLLALSHPDFAEKAVEFFQRNPERFKKIEADLIAGLGDATDAESIVNLSQTGSINLAALISGGHDAEAD